MKKPPRSPSKHDSRSPESPERQVFSPVPTKLPKNYDKENNPEGRILPQNNPIDEISLLVPQKPIHCLELAKDLKKVTRKVSTSFIINKKYEKKLNKSLLGNNIVKNISSWSKNFASKIMTSTFESPRRPLQANNLNTPDIEKNKHRVFTPVLTGKKPKTQYSGVSHQCKRVSLFDTTQSKSQSTSETYGSLKEPLKTEASCTFTENSPLKNHEKHFETFPDQSFSSPTQTIQIVSPKEQVLEVTPETSGQEYATYMVLSPDMIKNNYRIGTLQAPKKGIEAYSPESQGFSLSSSSEQEIISDISFLESPHVVMANGCKVNVGFIDREIQTDQNYAQIIQLLNDDSVINGLKTLGKITEILMVVNSQYNK
ncbi:hypothetical protein SteCoe_32263 [Stentor coeruleus]|uniref:Uncharacterized protein n=1 Tax=Stentor coeruleus TaxID=5963 RepID=A0A1R2AZD0_9CILI|nr:hypothetical protein SteCoe_32263 [Stentor coeruleus]